VVRGLIERVRGVVIAIRVFVPDPVLLLGLRRGHQCSRYRQQHLLVQRADRGHLYVRVRFLSFNAFLQLWLLVQILLLYSSCNCFFVYPLLLVSYLESLKHNFLILLEALICVLVLRFYLSWTHEQIPKLLSVSNHLASRRLVLREVTNSSPACSARNSAAPRKFQSSNSKYHEEFCILKECRRIADRDWG